MIIDTLEVLLGFKVESTKLHEFIKNLGELNLNAVVSTAGLDGIVTAIDAIIQKADQLGTELNRLSGITGVSQQAFQAWDLTAQNFNVTAGSTSSQIAKIQQDIIQMEKFGTGPATLWMKAFGVNAMGRSSDPGGVFRDILKGMQGMTDEQRRFWMQGTDIDQQMIQLVDHVDEIDISLANSKNTFQDIQKLHQDLNKLSQSWARLLMALGAALEPILRPLLDMVTGIFEIIQNTEESFGGWVRSLVTVIGHLTVAFGIIRGIMSAVRIAGGVGLLSAGAVATAGAAGSAAVPFLAGGAAIFALYDFLKQQQANKETNIEQNTEQQTNKETNIEQNTEQQTNKEININHNYNIYGGNTDDVYRAVRRGNASVDPQAADSREPQSSY